MYIMNCIKTLIKLIFYKCVVLHNYILYKLHFKYDLCLREGKGNVKIHSYTKRVALFFKKCFMTDKS